MHPIYQKSERETGLLDIFMGGVPGNWHPITLNGNMCIMCGMMKFEVAFAVETEVCALFMNSKDTKVIRLILAEMEHTQPPTPIHCGNKTAACIANDTVKNIAHDQ
jgi:hypothetical protein